MKKNSRTFRKRFVRYHLTGHLRQVEFHGTYALLRYGAPADRFFYQPVGI